MQNVFDLEEGTNILRDDSYVLSYPYLVRYFKDKDTITANELICGSHMVYGWMPTIVELYPENGLESFNEIADVLNIARSTGDLSDSQLTSIASLVNNSLVGASKLLHFVAPDKFAIWDSKIYSFVFEQRPHNYRVQKTECYRTYLEKLNSLRTNDRFKSFHKSVVRKIGYDVSALRSLEIVMFLNAPVYGG